MDVLEFMMVWNESIIIITKYRKLTYFYFEGGKSILGGNMGVFDV